MRSAGDTEPVDISLIDRAKQSILDVTLEQAAAHCWNDAPRRWARRAHAAQLLASSTQDSDVLDSAGTENIYAMNVLAGTPCGSAGDLALKLAVAVRELYSEGAPAAAADAAAAALCASCLADVVIVGDRPITLHDRATDEVKNADDAAAWFRREGVPQ